MGMGMEWKEARERRNLPGVRSFLISLVICRLFFIGDLVLGELLEVLPELSNCGPHALNDFRNLCNPTSPTTLYFNSLGTDRGNLGAAFGDLMGSKDYLAWTQTDDLFGYAARMKANTFTPVELPGHWVGLHKDSGGQVWLRCTQTQNILPLDPKSLSRAGFDVSDVRILNEPLSTNQATKPFLDNPECPSWRNKFALAPNQRRPHLPIDCTTTRGVPRAPRGAGCAGPGKAGRTIIRKVPLLKYVFVGAILRDICNSAAAGEVHGVARGCIDLSPLPNPYDVYDGGVATWNLGVDIYTYGWKNNSRWFPFDPDAKMPDVAVPPPPGGKIMY